MRYAGPGNSPCARAVAGEATANRNCQRRRHRQAKCGGSSSPLGADACDEQRTGGQLRGERSANTGAARAQHERDRQQPHAGQAHDRDRVTSRIGSDARRRAGKRPAKPGFRVTGEIAAAGRGRQDVVAVGAQEDIALPEHNDRDDQDRRVQHADNRWREREVAVRVQPEQTHRKRCRNGVAHHARNVGDVPRTARQGPQVGEIRFDDREKQPMTQVNVGIDPKESPRGDVREFVLRSDASHDQRRQQRHRSASIARESPQVRPAACVRQQGRGGGADDRDVEQGRRPAEERYDVRAAEPSRGRRRSIRRLYLAAVDGENEARVGQVVKKGRDRDVVGRVPRREQPLDAVDWQPIAEQHDRLELDRADRQVPARAAAADEILAAVRRHVQREKIDDRIRIDVQIDRSCHGIIPCRAARVCRPTFASGRCSLSPCFHRAPRGRRATDP
jgi:hypothetical protein